MRTILPFQLDPKKEAFIQAVRHLVRECNFDNSESGSEAFLDLLLDAARLVQQDVIESHRSGLCLDTTVVLGDYLSVTVA